MPAGTSISQSLCSQMVVPDPHLNMAHWVPTCGHTHLEIGLFKNLTLNPNKFSCDSSCQDLKVVNPTANHRFTKSHHLSWFTTRLRVTKVVTGCAQAICIPAARRNRSAGSVSCSCAGWDSPLPRPNPCHPTSQAQKETASCLKHLIKLRFPSLGWFYLVAWLIKYE